MCHLSSWKSSSVGWQQQALLKIKTQSWVLLFCRLWPANVRFSPFLRKSGLPFFTVEMIMSPTQADGKRLSLAPKPLTAITYKFFAPVLSAQLITAPTGRPNEILNLPPPTPPRPLEINGKIFKKNTLAELFFLDGSCMIKLGWWSWKSTSCSVHWFLRAKSSRYRFWFSSVQVIKSDFCNYLF